MLNAVTVGDVTCLQPSELINCIAWLKIIAKLCRLVQSSALIRKRPHTDTDRGSGPYSIEGETIPHIYISAHIHSVFHMLPCSVETTRLSGTSTPSKPTAVSLGLENGQTTRFESSEASHICLRGTKPCNLEHHKSSAFSEPSNNQNMSNR